jgi:hypothetical protein
MPLPKQGSSKTLAVGSSPPTRLSGLAGMVVVYQMPSRTSTRRVDLKRHIVAVRAFHTGLVAETQRRLYLLSKMALHIDCLRRPSMPPHHKLRAAEESCRHLQDLGDTHRRWRATYTDLMRHMRRLREHLRRLVNEKQPG